MNICPLSKRRTALHALVGIVLAGASLSATSADYPDRTVQMVVSVQAGGSTDTAARLIAEKLTDRLGQPFVVVNKP
ncbi:MAG: tripartite tricarboxylate transporter substrate binding protein, partial [Burkholderiales bacterium]